MDEKNGMENPKDLEEKDGFCWNCMGGENRSLFCICINKEDRYRLGLLIQQEITKREDLKYHRVHGDEGVVNLGTEQHCLNTRQKKSLSRKKRVVDEKSSDYTRAVDAWFACYKEKYGITPPFGAMQGRQLKSIIAKTTGIDEFVALVKQYFAGPYPDSIDAGHPLSEGYASFGRRIDMLRADLTNPGRRSTSALLRKHFRRAEEAIGEGDEMAKAMRLLSEQPKLTHKGEK